MPRPPLDQPLLNLELILKTAMRLIDAEGLDKLSMRKLARELEVTPPSLYHWIKNRDELVKLVVEKVLCDLPLPSLDKNEGWECELRNLARAYRELWRKHPALLPILATTPEATPALMALRERLLEMLRVAGIPEPKLPSALAILPSFMSGLIFAELRGDFSDAQRESEAAVVNADPGAYPGLIALERPAPEALFEESLNMIAAFIESLASS